MPLTVSMPGESATVSSSASETRTNVPHKFASGHGQLLQGSPSQNGDIVWAG